MDLLGRRRTPPRPASLPASQISPPRQQGPGKIMASELEVACWALGNLYLAGQLPSWGQNQLQWSTCSVWVQPSLPEEETEQAGKMVQAKAALKKIQHIATVTSKHSQVSTNEENRQKRCTRVFAKQPKTIVMCTVTIVILLACALHWCWHRTAAPVIMLHTGPFPQEKAFHHL